MAEVYQVVGAPKPSLYTSLEGLRGHGLFGMFAPLSPVNSFASDSRGQATVDLDHIE